MIWRFVGRQRQRWFWYRVLGDTAFSGFGLGMVESVGTEAGTDNKMPGAGKFSGNDVSHT